MAFKDKTFCASPNCTNECGRKMTPKEEKDLAGCPDELVSYAYCCGEPDENEE